MLNTKIIKAPDYKNYKSVSLPFTAPNDGYICGGVYSLGTTACYIYTKIADTSGIANTANAKIELDGPIKTIAYGSDKNKWAFQQQFPDGVILSLGISETEIFYDYYDGKTWTRKWTR